MKSISPTTKRPTDSAVATVRSTISYVEKKTCEFAVRAARIAGFPSTIGAGLAEIGFIFESFTSSSSTLRCSCGWGRLVSVMMQFSHAVGQRRRTQTAPSARLSAVEILLILGVQTPIVNRYRQPRGQPNRRPRNHLFCRDLGSFLASK